MVRDDNTEQDGKQGRLMMNIISASALKAKSLEERRRGAWEGDLESPIGLREIREVNIISAV